MCKEDGCTPSLFIIVTAFPPKSSVIAFGYFRFALSFRDVEEYQKLVELRDLTGNQLRRTVTTQIADYQFTQTTVFSDGVVAPAFNDGAMAPDAAGGEEWLALVRLALFPLQP